MLLGQNIYCPACHNAEKFKESLGSFCYNGSDNNESA